MSGYPSVSDENHDWFYVAVNTEDGVKIGYSCATYHPTDGTAVNYLIEKKKKRQMMLLQKRIQNKKKIIMNIHIY